MWYLTLELGGAPILVTQDRVAQIFVTGVNSDDCNPVFFSVFQFFSVFLGT